MLLKELAIKYGFKPEELLEILRLENYPIETVDDEIDVDFIEYFLEQTYGDDLKKTKIVRAKKQSKGAGDIEKRYKKQKNSSLNQEKFVPVLEKQPMTIAVASKQSGVLVSAIISFFLSKKKLYSINSVLKVEEVVELAANFNIPLKVQEENQSLISHEKRSWHIDESKTQDEGLEPRPPVVVVVGHVDHGKTTLLDTIREKAVAQSEKGGITQHVGAYVVKKNKKEIVFLDTPGHAAFTMLRSRGVSVADIAILVVAADDGVMPQTVESIKMLKKTAIQVIVAITKIDRVDTTDFSRIYQQLSEHDVLIEAWGGAVPVVFVSAIKKQGVDELLDVIILTSDLLAPQANVIKKPIGYIIESKINKGLGPVATVILQQGIIRVGDWFYANDIIGKVAFLIDSEGNKVKQMKPAYPFIIGGADTLLDVGGELIVEDQKIVKAMASKNKNEKISMTNTFGGDMNASGIEHPYNIIVKADVLSSLQALIKVIKEIKGQYYYAPVILSSSVGEVTENDVTFALQSKSIIYAFTVKCPAHVKSLADKIGVKILYFDVIYHLVEDILQRIEKPSEAQYVRKKIGDISVLKIFTSKALGVIAGFRVTSGIIKAHAEIVVMRNKNEIGKGYIKSLQREKQSVKELAKGYEGAIIVEGFQDWHEGDIGEIYIEVKEG